MNDPNYKNLIKILERQKPDRYTLFEFFMNKRLYENASGKYFADIDANDRVSNWRIIIDAFYNLGYDYATLHILGAKFNTGAVHKKSSISQNETNMIPDRESLKKYEWPDIGALDEYEKLDELEGYFPEGMKAVVCGPGGMLESLIDLMGYDNLCYMIYDDPGFVHEVAENIGSRLVMHYKMAGKRDVVCAMIVNDDWGHSTQTMLSVEHMRQFVFPWHKKIVKAIHESGKPAILHSCGNPRAVIDDVIEMGYDGRHSYEDKIYPVEQFYEDYHDKIAVLGGIDVDYVIRQDKRMVYERAVNMLNRSDKRGSYALGTGNSVPLYMPDDKFLNLISAATDNR